MDGHTASSVQPQRKGQKVRRLIASKIADGSPLTAERFLEIFKLCDEDGDRRLEGREIDRFLQKFVLSSFHKTGENAATQDLQQLKSDFMNEFDANKDGKISVGELSYVLSSKEAFRMVLCMQHLAGATVDYMKVWKKYDKDLTGFIDHEELKLFLREMVVPIVKSKGMSEKELDSYAKDVMEYFDDNSDGKLRYSEFIRMMPNHQNTVHKIVKQLNGTRKLAPGYIQTLLQNYDKDGNGCLENNEITHLCRDILEITKKGQYDAHDVENFRGTLLVNYDKDKNNQIDIRELRMIMEEVMESANMQSMADNFC